VAARGGDAVVLIDSLAALHPPLARKVMAAARNVDGGGSLTVVATAPDALGGETTVIALDATLTSTGRLPALDLVVSGTLRPELLVGRRRGRRDRPGPRAGPRGRVGPARGVAAAARAPRRGAAAAGPAGSLSRWRCGRSSSSSLLVAAVVGLPADRRRARRACRRRGRTAGRATRARP
jgi:transcription termination factor Rho